MAEGLIPEQLIHFRRSVTVNNLSKRKVLGALMHAHAVRLLVKSTPSKIRS